MTVVLGLVMKEVLLPLVAVKLVFCSVFGGRGGLDMLDMVWYSCL